MSCFAGGFRRILSLTFQAVPQTSTSAPVRARVFLPTPSSCPASWGDLWDTRRACLVRAFSSARTSRKWRDLRDGQLQQLLLPSFSWWLSIKASACFGKRFSLFRCFRPWPFSGRSCHYYQHLRQGDNLTLPCLSAPIERKGMLDRMAAKWYYNTIVI